MVSLILSVAAGCGRDTPPMSTVRGKVLLDGKPITGAQYTSVALTPQAGRMAKGVVAEDGTFELQTYEEGDGAVVGPARLAVSATVDDASAPAGEKYPGVRWVIPYEFASPDTSGLSCEVKPGTANYLTIQLKSDGTGEVLPGEE